MRTARVALVLAAAALGALPVAAGIPDWAKPFAASPPALPEGLPEWPERTLFSETSIVVSPDGGTWRVRRRTLVQVLSNRVDDMQFGSFAFDDTTKLKKSKGWHIPPGERAERNLGGALDLSLPTDFLTDTKARVVALDGVRKGSLVMYEFDAESRPYVLTTAELFYDDAPVAFQRWSIELPPGWSLKHAWLPNAGPEPQLAGATWTFERRDFVPTREETLGVEPSVMGPRLLVALAPPAGVTPTTPAFADWGAVGTWYQGLAKGRDAPSPAIEAMTKEATAKAGPETLARIRAVAVFVRDRVRYLAREVGIGGYQPHYATQVLAELYGDCKDKGTLLRAALASAGFASYPILIHATNPNTVAPGVPNAGSFNHFVIGVQWPKDEPVPPEAASATVLVPGHGTLLVVDATDERTWPGSLPDNLAGKTGLAVIDGHGVLVTLPDAEPAFHRIERSSAVTLGTDRSMDIRRVSRFYGGPAAEARQESAVSFKERRESVERSLREVWPGAEIGDYAVSAEDADGAFVETVSLKLPANAPALQENAFYLFHDATRDIDRVPLGRRTVAVKYPYPIRLRYETTISGAPAADPVPAGVKSQGDGWIVETSFNRADKAIHGVWTVTLAQTQFEPSAFPALKQFWSAASKAASPGLRLAP